LNICDFLQVLAAQTANLLMLDLSMSIAFTTVLIDALLNAKQGLSVTSDQASWLGEFLFLPPVGPNLENETFYWKTSHSATKNITI
jgi:hypothetical protein